MTVSVTRPMLCNRTDAVEHLLFTRHPDMHENGMLRWRGAEAASAVVAMANNLVGPSVAPMTTQRGRADD